MEQVLGVRCRCVALLLLSGSTRLQYERPFKVHPLIGAGPSQSDKLMNHMEEGTASVQNFIVSSLDRVTAGAKNVGSSVGSGVSRRASV